MERSQSYRQIAFQDIEKYVTNSQSSSEFNDRLKKYFFCGVIVEKKWLSVHNDASKGGFDDKLQTDEQKQKTALYYKMKYGKFNTANKCHIRFKICDMNRYKYDLVQKIKEIKSSRMSLKSMSVSEEDKHIAYKLMNFTPDRYKTIEWILFNDVAEQFSKYAKYGDLLMFLGPSVMDQKYNSGICITVKSLDQVIQIGRCADYGICDGFDCREFLNPSKHRKCMLHQEEENEKYIKKIKANRANLRSDYIDSK